MLKRTFFLLCAPALLVLFVITGCGSAPFSTVSSTSNSLVAEYSVNLAKSGEVTVEFGPTAEYGYSTAPVHSTVGPTVVEVAGMKQNSTYHMRAHVEYDDGASVLDTDHTFTTGSIPSGLIPTMTVQTTSGMTPQPGVELVDTLQGSTTSTVYATDLEGNVIWYYAFPDAQTGSTLYPAKLLPNGDFLALIAPYSGDPLNGSISGSTLNEIREFDLAGNIKRSMTMATLNTELVEAGYNLTLQLFTHDFTLLPNGHLLVITNTLKSFTNLVGLPGTTQVLGDVVVDLDENWKPVWIWNEFDHLDVNRHPMGFPDWTHSNALAYSTDDGNFLISLRHQHWILKVDYRDGAGAGDILWTLGEGGNFTLEGATDPTDWFYAQHDVNFVSPNTTGSFKIAIMDNGDDRLFPSGDRCTVAGTALCYSTIPVMLVDENAKTASFLFHDILPPSLFNSFAGSTRVLANQNVEYNLAGLNNAAATYEVTPTATPQTVWQMNVAGENTYRSYRIPSLYPGVQW